LKKKYLKQAERSTVDIARGRGSLVAGLGKVKRDRIILVGKKKREGVKRDGI